jgi:hypothetical protein
MNKYRNKKTVVDNVTFDSMKEAARYQQLKLMVKGGYVKDLELQPSYPIFINKRRICTYKADFKYQFKQGDEWQEVIEDVKGMKTPTYRLKKKLMLAVHGIEIKEV